MAIFRRIFSLESSGFMNRQATRPAVRFAPSAMGEIHWKLMAVVSMPVPAASTS